MKKEDKKFHLWTLLSSLGVIIILLAIVSYYIDLIY